MSACFPAHRSRLLGPGTVLLLLAAVAAAPAPSFARAQATAGFPAATTLAGLTTYPNFYHLKTVVVRGALSMTAGQTRLVPVDGVGRGVELIVRGEQPSAGTVEVRGQFWDVGRLPQDDPGTAAYDLQGFVKSRLGDRWPAHGELLVVNAASIVPAAPRSPKPSLRLLALDPDSYDGQVLTVRGQFGGRNILGDLPQSPRVSRTDFVLRAAGGAAWVTGLAPKGRGWNLELDSKLDTAQWLEVTGTLRHGNGLVWIEASKVAQAKQEEEAPEAADAAPAVLPPPQPEVVFTLPSDEDTDVPATTKVKFQTSRDLDPNSFPGHIVASYVGAPGGSAIPLKAVFDRTSRVLEVTFAEPLERFKTVKVELREGIKGTDGQPLKPMTLTFSIGG